MANRYIRMRRYNPSSLSGKFDTLFPQAITNNILRSEDAGVLESDLLQYDRHLDNSVVHMNRALSEGNARALSVRLKDVVLVDNFPLLLTLHVGLECEPTLSFNGSDPHEIISASGDRIPGGQIEGSVIFLVWKETVKKWILISSDNFTDVTKIVLPVESEYVYQALTDDEELIVIPGFNKKSDKIQINYGQTILRAGLDYEFLVNSLNTIRLIGFGLKKDDLLYCTITTFIITAKRGHYRYELKAQDFAVVADNDGAATFQVPSEANGAHSVVINYNQTVLRNNLDYTYSESGDSITLTQFTLSKGETLVFTVTQFVEAPGEIVPNNWGATGNYRYSLNVVHTSYVATEDGVAVICVPGFNFKTDDISVIQDNKLFIYDVDYSVDEIGNVVLLKKTLAEGEEIFFTILQGAMMDVPNFNVIQAKGQDGQHLILDMSYSVLVEYYTLLVRLKHDLLSAPTVKCIDGPAEPVCDCFGTPIRGGYKAGSYLWLVYSYEKHQWYSLSHSQLDVSQIIPENLVSKGSGNFIGAKFDANGQFVEYVIEHKLGRTPEQIYVSPSEPPTLDADGKVMPIGDIWTHADETYLYVGNSGTSTSKFDWTVTAEAATNDLRTYIEQEIDSLKTRPGNIVPYLSTFTAVADATATSDPIDNFNGEADKIIVNLNQTILRREIDFIVNADNSITLTQFTLNAGDILQFTVLKQDVE